MVGSGTGERCVRCRACNGSSRTWCNAAESHLPKSCQSLAKFLPKSCTSAARAAHGCPTDADDCQILPSCCAERAANKAQALHRDAQLCSCTRCLDTRACFAVATNAFAHSVNKGTPPKAGSWLKVGACALVALRSDASSSSSRLCLAGAGKYEPRTFELLCAAAPVLRSGAESVT